jgi:WD40 repeat protein
MSNGIENIHTVIAIHGIRSYGRWQERLETTLERDERWRKDQGRKEVLIYKYGVFTLLSFLIPFLRTFAVNQFRSYLESVFEGRCCQRVDIVAHSFGAYLAIEALASPDLSGHVQIHTAILCGGAISPNRNLSKLVGTGRRINRLINECGINDGVLLLTLGVFGVGMAGRLGLQGFGGRSFRNRYHRLAHSGYFEHRDGTPYDGFMSRWWLPLLLSDAPISKRDRRPEKPTLSDRIWRVLGENGASVTVSLYVTVLGALSRMFLFFWLEARQAKLVAEQQRIVAEQQRNEAIRQTNSALLAQSRLLAGLATQVAQGGDFGTAALLALEALPDNTRGAKRPYAPEAELQLNIAWNQLRERVILDVQNFVFDAVYSSDNKRILTTSLDLDLKSTVRLFNAETGESIGEPLTDLAPGPVSISPDGKRIGNIAKRIVRMWDANTLMPTKPLEGHAGDVSMVAFSQDGKRIVTASNDKTVRLWDAETGKQIGGPLIGHQDSVLSAEFSRDYKRIVTASSDRTARLWDAETGRQIGAPFTGHREAVLIAAFSSNGERIVTASNDKTARIWDVKTRRQLGAPLSGHEDAVSSAAFSPDGARIFTRSLGEVRLWDVQTGKQIGEKISGAYTAFSPDGKFFVTAWREGAQLWDSKTGKPIEPAFKGHAQSVLKATFGLNGKRLVTASYDGTARVWDAEIGKSIGQPLEGSLTATWFNLEEQRFLATFSPDGTRIVAASDDKTVRLWDGETGKLVGEPLAGHEEAVWMAAFSQDSRRIVTVSRDETARIWDAATGRPIGGPLKGHEGDVLSVAFSLDGKRIVTASEDNTARLWDAETGKQIGGPLSGHEDAVLSASFSQDGKLIITASRDKTARLWDGQTGTPIGEPLRGHEGAVTIALFSPDGKRIVTSVRGHLKTWLWDAQTAKQIGEPLEGIVSFGAFNPDSTRIVTARRGIDYTARLWDAQTGSRIAILEGHDSWVLDATFSADGKRIVTASDDKTARLWDAETGKPISAPLRGHENPVLSAMFSPDNKRILTASEGEAARLWHVFADTHELVARVKKDIPRCLRPAEREQRFLALEPPNWCIESQKWPYHRKAGKQAVMPIQ